MGFTNWISSDGAHAPPCLTVGLSYAYHELRVKGLAQPLGVHQLHGAVLQATLNV